MRAALAGWWVGITPHRTLHTGQQIQLFDKSLAAVHVFGLPFIEISSIVGLLDMFDFVLAFKACRDTRLDI